MKNEKNMTTAKYVKATAKYEKATARYEEATAKYVYENENCKNRKKEKMQKKNFQSFILIEKNEKICSATFSDLISGCQCSRSRMSTYPKQGVKVSKKMSLYQYP